MQGDTIRVAGPHDQPANVATTPWPDACKDGNHQPRMWQDVTGIVWIGHGDHKMSLRDRDHEEGAARAIHAFAERCHAYDTDEYER